MSLRDAVAFVEQHSDPDGWMVRVTGTLSAPPNALIPSTEDAITGENFAEHKRRRRRLRATRQAMVWEADTDPMAPGEAGSRLYAARVESGVVCAATWQAIHALPPALRIPYEQLTVDSIVFYPRVMAAVDGRQFDELVRRYRGGSVGWQQFLDESAREVVRRERLDEDYVTLRFPLRDLAARVGELRREARKAHGKGSAADAAFKFQINSTYGVLAGRFYPVNNY